MSGDMRLQARWLRLLLNWSFVSLFGCGGQNGNVRQARDSAGASMSPTARASALVEARLDRHFERAPAHARSLGLHQYDGKIAPVSTEALKATLEDAKTFLAQAAELDLSGIDEPTRLDVQLAILDAKQEIFNLEKRRTANRILAYSEEFDVSSYLVRDYAPLEERVARLLDHVEAASKEVPNIIAILDQKQPRTHLETAKKTLAGMREYYEGDVKKECTPVLARDPALKARYDKLIPEGLAAVERLSKWVDEVGMKNATDDFALGEAAFLELLKVNEGLEITMPELEKMAEEDYKKNYEAYVAIAKRAHPKLTTKQVAEKLANERLPKDKVLEIARKELDALLAFIESKSIVTIGGDERALVAVTPPFQRWNSAFLNQAGPFEEAKGSYYYISPPDPSWPKEMQDAYIPYEGDLLSTSTHEVYPGHFVQGLHQKRAKTRAQKTLASYAFVEGWAHYAEQVMFDEGFGKGNWNLELGQLSNALLRNCRFLAAIGLHVHGMTVKQADTLFQEKCFIDPGNAIQQAYRGTFDPGYLSYTLGKLQIAALRQEFFSRRKDATLRDFHDWLLSFGAAPVQLIRERL
jgi:uncharacterized protein DUF885